MYVCQRDTNWYTITTFRQLAVNVGHSVLKGDRVVATGRLRIKEWTNEGRTGTTIDVEADAVGHDLTWGTTAFTRVAMTSSAPVQEAVESPIAEAGFGAGAADAWSVPLTPVTFDERDGAGVGGYGDEGSDSDERDDIDEQDDDAALRQPSFTTADSTPF